MNYELMYIVPATLTDEEVAGIEAVVKAAVEKQSGTVVEASRLGKFRLAYPIQNTRHGHYNLVQFTIEPALVAKLDEQLRITANILRHLILRADEVGPGKYDLVQFTEVNVELKDDRPRRRATKEAKPGEEVKVAEASDTEKKEEEKPAEASDADIDQKIDEALKGNAA